MRFSRQNKESWRRILVTIFVMLYLAEFSSHALICTGLSSKDAEAMSQRGSSHEDPCKSLILCNDSKQRDRQSPGFAHDATQHNALIDSFADLGYLLLLTKEPRIPSLAGEGLFRSLSPPTHPPKLA
jgi:hypothetical protein